MQQHHDHQSAWLLTGLAVRSGQRMGLHKSTITRNIPPFESELRLRLWWQIILLDCKAAKLSGFAMDIKADSYFSGQLPLNINDANLYPEMTGLPAEITSHSTEMVLCLVIYECTSFITKFPSLVDMGSCEEDELQKTSNYIIDEFVERLQNRFLCFCDEANSFQLLTTLLAKIFLSQIRIRALQALQRHQKNSTSSTGISHQMSAQHGEMLLIWHTDVVETTNKIYDTSALQQYIWFVHNLFPYESLVYILKVLQSRIKGSEVERAWYAVDVILNIFAGTDWLPCGNPNDGMYAAMGALAIKAWRARTSACLPDGLLSFRWVDILSLKLGMNQQRDDMAQAEDVAGVEIPGDTNPLNHFFPTGEAAGGQSMEIGWDYWTEFIEPL
ncbi:uncharacterized protein BHQ10_009202 [Talaromyces amestolkiae]|uniref:Xylanolytic transcriptional activator regulatory domain-containing protein n=1 Tax=Talaromyces amestolkiae TaxID=1196081 RepID=A0A364LBI7_TALAM|nr:uncharacterized protein BHQ10_009202 [Talaromyces amestolkiae]RAO73190.1 hypothetical protein BHQ10_009202 [Talaromyces amestolkiae]